MIGQRAHELFQAWMLQVDDLCVQRWGLVTDDLPDLYEYPYYLMFEDGMSPTEAIELIAEENEAP